jgi:hypothetical protein
VGAVVHALPPLAELLVGGRALHQPEPREVVVEVDLPDVQTTDTATGRPAHPCMEGGTVASLIERHLGREVVISTRPPGGEADRPTTCLTRKQ